MASMCVDIINPDEHAPATWRGPSGASRKPAGLSVDEDINPLSCEGAGPSAPLPEPPSQGAGEGGCGVGAAADAAWGTGVHTGTFLVPHLTAHRSRPASTASD